MRQANFSRSLLFTLVVACGGDSKSTGSDAAPVGDAASGTDAASTDAGGSPVPAMIVISGSALEQPTMAGVKNATIAAYRNGNDTTPVAMTTTDMSGTGTFALTISTGGVALDGYLKATADGFMDTYLYAPAPIADNTVAPVNMVKPAIFTVLSGVAQVTQDPAKGVIVLIVVSGTTADSMAVMGATVSSTPASDVRYSGSNGLPTPITATTMSTAIDGRAYMFNVPASTSVTVSATKSGSTFTSHGLKAVAGAFTTTLITP
jgi:hypothetical protein